MEGQGLVMEQRACERELSPEKATRIRLLVVELTGKPCPCDRGMVCPMFPVAPAATVTDERMPHAS